MLKIIELFAGIGAQTQALKNQGINHEVVAISEIDSYASKAYEILHGPVANLGDITKIEALPKADLWTYSFPCTDISLAGKLKGLEKGSNTHSSLLWEVQRLLDVGNRNNTLPSYLLMENVKNLISKKFKTCFLEWCDYLESLGYKNYYQVLNARDYGIPQNRERVFMISIRNNKHFNFPEKKNLKLKLFDLLEPVVDDKYFLSEKMIVNFSDLTDRNGYIRGLRFRPHEKSSNYAWTITTCSGSRATDNYIVQPYICALRGRLNENNEYEQTLEIGTESISHTLTTVPKDNLVILIPENTKKGFAVASIGDGVYINRCKSKRGVVQRSKIPTLKTSSSDIGVVVEHDQLISIRRLTPRECLRLMGWEDDKIDLLIPLFSNARLYKMAGNSIVVQCLEGIFRNLFVGINEDNKN